MKPSLLLIALLVGGCEQGQMKPPTYHKLVLPDTLTVVVNHYQASWNNSPEEYALRKYPGYRVLSVTFRGVANDPDIFYEVKICKEHRP